MRYVHVRGYIIRSRLYFDDETYSNQVPVASSSSKTLVKRSIKAKSGSEGFICIQCRGMFDSMSDLTKHSQRHSSGIFGAHSDEKDGVLLCTNGILSRLRWWRLKEIAFDIAGSLSDIHDEPKLVYSSDRHGFGLENLILHEQLYIFDCWTCLESPLLV